VTLPAPRVGLVIRYNFLWSHERDAGREEAAKDRPAAIVVAVGSATTGMRIIVAPITHAPSADLADSLPLSPTVCAKLGPDDRPQWLRYDELNRFIWPGYDLRPIPGSASVYAYGMLPRPLFEQLRARILLRQRAKAVSMQDRD